MRKQARNQSARYLLKSKVVIISTWILVSIMAIGIQAQEHAFSIHDMLAMDRIGDPRLSPDGKQVLFSVRTTDLEANRGRTDLWLMSLDGTVKKPLTTAPEADYNGRWDPDGQSIWFLSTRSGSSQVWRIPSDGGEAIQVTDLPLDVSNLVIASQGDYLAFTLEVFPGMTIAETKATLDQREASPETGMIFDKIFVRHWDQWKDGRRSHLFILPKHGGGEPRDLMKAMDADTPSKPFGGAEEICFTPDGQGLVFSARDAGAQEPWSTNFDLYYVSIHNNAPPRNLTVSNLAWDNHPVFSPDGKKLAYLVMKRPGYESDRMRVVVREWPNGKSRTLTEDWDHSPHTLEWSHDSQRLYITAQDTGQVPLFVVDVRKGTVKKLIEDGSVRAFTIGEQKLVYGRTNLQSALELFTANLDGTKVKPLTQWNTTHLAKTKMGDFEQFSFAGWNNDTVYGYLVKPIDFDPSKTYPVAFLIHGGPQGSFGNHFHYRWNPQVYAGAGYAAVMVDFHGSTGYGQAFTDSIRGDWGGKPLVDLKKGLAAVLEKYPWMDEERVGALGASFGGFMINWIAGQWSDRFRCLINHDGNLDERMAYFNTEELWFPEWDHQGTPWENPQGYAKHNPVNYVQNWKTPMLVIHGALDYRVVDTQGLGTFNALQRRGIPSRLLYFPDENHWVLKPHNSILWHETVIGWLDQWVKP